VTRVQKKAYTRPELVIISLKAEEVLAVGCKQSGGTVAVRNAAGCIVARICASKGS
jgi:hypothetical protein